MRARPIAFIAGVACLWMYGARPLAAQVESETPTTESRSSLIDVIRQAFEDQDRTWRPVVGIMVPGAGLGGGIVVQSPLAGRRFGASADAQISIHNYQQFTLRGGLLAGRRELTALR